MRMNDYQGNAMDSAIYPCSHKGKSKGIEYATMGLCGEAGEVAEKVKKHMRGDCSLHHLKSNLVLELGDVLWYVANLAFECGYTLEQVAEMNNTKLQLRRKNNTIQGNGDDR